MAQELSPEDHDRIAKIAANDGELAHDIMLKLNNKFELGLTDQEIRRGAHIIFVNRHLWGKP